MTQKEYLGDAVYASYDGFMLTLTTEDGIINPTNIIHLEPVVYRNLLLYVEGLKQLNPTNQPESVEND